jgi:hypothetical protein
VHFANDSLDLNTRGGRLSADIQAVVAADYIRNLREEAKKGILSLQSDKNLNALAESECTTRQIALFLRSPQSLHRVEASNSWIVIRTKSQKAIDLVALSV